MRRIRPLILSLTLCLLLTAALPAFAAKAPAAVQVTVNGTVTEATTALAVSGATVQIYLLNKGVYNLVATTTTDSSGNWSYDGKTGTYRFDFSATGAEPLSVTQSYPDKGTFTLATSLHCYGTLSGVVRDSATNLPIAGAQVDFFSQLPGGGWSEAPAASVTAPDGAYTSPNLATGVYAVKAAASGYTGGYFGGAEPTPVTVSRGAATTGLDITLTLVPTTATISGRLTNASGVGLHGFAYLFKQNADGTWPAYVGYAGFTKQVESDYAGYYTLTDVPLGTYRVRLFSIHLGTQWWLYQTSYDTATSLVLDTPGQVVTGVNAVFPPPAP